MADSLAQRQQPAAPAPGAGGSSSEGDAAPTAALQAECESLAAQLEEAKRLQQAAAEAAAAWEAECARLQQQVEQLQQEQAAAAGAAELPAADAAAEQPPAAPAAATSEPEPELAALQQQLAEKATRLEQLEFERDELQVRLEEQERQVAAHQAAPAKQQQAAAEGPVSGKPGAPGDDASEGAWRLAAGTGEHGQRAAEEAAAAQHKPAELRQRVQQLEGQVAALQAELAAARSGSNTAVAADAAAAADLRRQLEERSREVAALSQLSVKADATVQQYMAQLRRWARRAWHLCCAGCWGLAPSLQIEHRPTSCPPALPLQHVNGAAGRGAAAGRRRGAAGAAG